MLKHSVRGMTGEFGSSESRPPGAAASGRRGFRRGSRLLAVLGLALGLLAAPVPAAAVDEYDPEQAGHPLRLAAYMIHPFGVMLDYMIMRPAYWVGSHEPFRTLFGRTD